MEKIVELQGRIHSDLLNQERLILNGVDLHRHKPEVCLSSDDTTPAYKITIVDAILYGRGCHRKWEVGGWPKKPLGGGRLAKKAIGRWEVGQKSHWEVGGSRILD